METTEEDDGLYSGCGWEYDHTPRWGTTDGDECAECGAELEPVEPGDDDQ